MRPGRAEALFGADTEPIPLAPWWSLEPCPFCGSRYLTLLRTLRRGRAIDDDRCWQWVLLCDSCAAEGPWAVRDWVAIRRWNARPRGPA